MNKYVCANTISPSDLSDDEEGDVLGDEQQAARDEEKEASLKIPRPNCASEPVRG